MSRLNHASRAIGLGAIGVLALAGCGMGGSNDAGESKEKTSICKEDASDKTTLDSAPKTDWKDGLNGLKIPASDKFGPEKVDDDKVPSCFSHSPEGALFAATNYSLPVVSQDNGLMAKVIRKQAIANDSRDKVADRFEEEGQSASSSSQAENLKVAGFKLADYTKDKAAVKILISAHDGAGYGELTFTVQWKDDDWRFDADADTEDMSFKQVEGPDGYTTWGPSQDDGSSSKGS